MIDYVNTYFDLNIVSDGINRDMCHTFICTGDMYGWQSGTYLSNQMMP